MLHFSDYKLVPKQKTSMLKPLLSLNMPAKNWRAKKEQTYFEDPPLDTTGLTLILWKVIKLNGFRCFIIIDYTQPKYTGLKDAICVEERLTITMVIDYFMMTVLAEKEASVSQLLLFTTITKLSQHTAVCFSADITSICSFSWKRLL